MIATTCRRPGFTLVELKVLVFIGIAFVGVVLTGCAKIMQQSSNRGLAECKNRLRDIGLAVKNFEAQALTLPYNDANVSIFSKLLVAVDRPDLVGIHVPASVRIPSFNCPADTSDAALSPGAPGTYVLNAAVFRGSPSNPLRSRDVMDETSNTIIGGERLAACGTTPIYTSWNTTGADTQPAPNEKLLIVVASPPNDLFGVNGLQADGSAPAANPVGMGVKAGVTQATCPAVPGNQWTAPAGSYYFQSAHPGGANFIRGDAGTVTFPGEYDPLLLNYFCAGNRSNWSGPSSWCTTTYGAPQTIPRD